ncbi:MAG TPA: hypothetical protein VN696_02440 [Pyrinomonadaceae bacterium]|nr:hypothetical protein [Pyrinomonadaceae bacterium]
MTVTLELKPEIEDLVKAEAEARGLSVEAYIQQELESKLIAEENPNKIPYDEWLRRWKEWLSSHDYIKAPPLSDEAVSRESIYREREDAQL